MVSPPSSRGVNAGRSVSVNQLRYAVGAAGLASIAGFAIAGKGSSLTYSALVAASIFVAGSISSASLVSNFERSALGKARIAILITAAVLALGWVGLLLRHVAPANAIATLAFVAGAFATWQSFALYSRQDLGFALILSIPGVVVAVGAREPVVLVVAVLLAWIGAGVISLVLVHATELEDRLEHSDLAVGQEGRDWWPRVLGRTALIALAVALLIALISPILRLSLPRLPSRVAPLTTSTAPSSPSRGGGSSSPAPGGSSGSSSRPGAVPSGALTPGSGDQSGGDSSDPAGGHAGGAPGSDIDSGPQPSSSPGSGAGGGGQATAQPGTGRPSTGPSGQATPSPGGTSTAPGSPGASSRPGQSQGQATPGGSAAPGAGGSGEQGPGQTGFSPDLTVPSGEIKVDDTPILRIQARAPTYFRGAAFETYENGRWYAGSGSHELAGSSPYRIPVDEGGVSRGEAFDQTVEVLANQPAVVISAYRPGQLYIAANDASPGPEVAPTILSNDVIATSAPFAVGSKYSVTSAIPTQNPETLRKTTGSAPEGFERYLQLPPELSPRVASLASEITQGKTTRYEKTAAVIDFMRQHAVPATQVAPPAKGVDPVENYLFEGGFEGFSNHLASATAVLLRESGVETRVVSGYRPHNPADKDGFLIKSSDAYDWVEVWFPTVGWVTFDAGANALAPVKPESPLKKLLRWLREHWLWLLLLAVLLVAAGYLITRAIRSAARQRAKNAAQTEAEDLLTRLENAVRVPREGQQTPREYARALWWKLPPDDGRLAEDVLDVVAESAYSPAPVAPERSEKAFHDVSLLKAHTSARSSESSETQQRVN